MRLSQYMAWEEWLNELKRVPGTLAKTAMPNPQITLPSLSFRFLYFILSKMLL